MLEKALALKPDLFVVGNVVSRGNALMEAILDAGLPYTSGPQWLSEHVLQGRHVVIQGPPGTGKSQTIANMIASAPATISAATVRWTRDKRYGLAFHKISQNSLSQLTKFMTLTTKRKD